MAHHHDVGQISEAASEIREKDSGDNRLVMSATGGGAPWQHTKWYAGQCLISDVCYR